MLHSPHWISVLTTERFKIQMRNKEAKSAIAFPLQQRANGRYCFGIQIFIASGLGIGREDDLTCSSIRRTNFAAIWFFPEKRFYSTSRSLFDSAAKCPGREVKGEYQVWTSASVRHHHSAIPSRVGSCQKGSFSQQNIPKRSRILGDAIALPSADTETCD